MFGSVVWMRRGAVEASGLKTRCESIVAGQRAHVYQRTPEYHAPAADSVHFQAVPLRAFCKIRFYSQILFLLDVENPKLFHSGVVSFPDRKAISEAA
jgi:hypothetical protein